MEAFLSIISAQIIELHHVYSGFLPDPPRSSGNIEGMSLHKREDPLFVPCEHFWHRAVSMSVFGIIQGYWYTYC